jgi:transposase
MKALHGGKAKHDPLDAPKLAALLRGGMRPQASGYPAAMRAPRDLLRRRTHLMRQRAELLAHVQMTNSPYNLPEIGKKIAYKANRDGVAERFAEAGVQKTIEVDLVLITQYDERLKDLELSLLKTAQPHDANTRYLLQTVPGMGKMLSLVLRPEIPRSDRCPSVQAFASDARLGKWSTEAGGKRVGPSGKKIGTAPLKGAFSDAATLFWRRNPPGQNRLARLEQKHDQGKALSILAHQLGRAVYCLRKRKVACEMEIFLQTAGSRAGEPGASLDSSGMSLERACAQPSPAASLNAKARLSR